MSPRSRPSRTQFRRLVAEPFQRLRRHLALAAIGEQARRLLERQPAGLRYLDPHRLLDRADPAPPRTQEEEAHDLEDPFAPLPRGGVDVADVAELLDEPPLDARLLAYLPHGRLGRRFAGVDLALRQRPDALAALRTDRREHRPAADRPHEHSSGGELPFHVPVLPVGTCATRVPAIQ